MIRFSCPHCGFSLFAPAGCEGKSFRCLQCKQSVEVPREGHAEPPPVTSQTIVGDFVAQFPAAVDPLKKSDLLSSADPSPNATMMGKFLLPATPGAIQSAPRAKPAAPAQPPAPVPPASGPDRGKWVPVLLATNAILLLALVVALGVIIVLMVYLGKASSARTGQAASRGVSAAWPRGPGGIHSTFNPGS